MRAMTAATSTARCARTTTTRDDVGFDSHRGRRACVVRAARKDTGDAPVRVIGTVVGAATASAMVGGDAARAASNEYGIDWEEMMKTTPREVSSKAVESGAGSERGGALSNLADGGVSVPEFKMPENMPEMKMPDLGKFELPSGLDKIEAPKMPDFGSFKVPSDLTDKMSSFKVPDVPKFDAPKLDSFKMPEVPKMDMPKMDMPKVNIPAPPTPPTPAAPPAPVAAPPVPESAAVAAAPVEPVEAITAAAPKPPSLPELPKVPEVQVPKIQVEVPKFEAPDIDFSGATSALNDATASLNAGKAQFDSSINAGRDAFEGSVKGATDALDAFQSDVYTSVGSGVSSSLDAFKGVLPSEFANLVDLAKQDSDVAIAAAVALFLAPQLLGGVVGSLRGYSGTKRPAFINEQLEKNSRAFLIDTRSAEDRKADGVPDLRKGARNRGAAVEVNELDAVTRRATANPRAVELRIAGERVQKLTKRGGQIYFMGPDAAALAKQVQSMGGGRKCFTVEGNFEAWRSVGLKIRRSGSYEKNVLDAVGEGTADIARAGSQFVQTRVGTARTSVTSKYKSSTAAEKAAVLVGFVALAYAVTEYEKTLAFIGFMGLFWSLYNKAISYDSPQALFEDVSTALSPVTSIVGEAASVAGASAMDAASSAGAQALDKAKSSGAQAFERAKQSSADFQVSSLADLPDQSEGDDEEDSNE
jgi:hypothetical protein